MESKRKEVKSKNVSKKNKDDKIPNNVLKPDDMKEEVIETTDIKLSKVEPKEKEVIIKKKTTKTDKKNEDEESKSYKKKTPYNCFVQDKINDFVDVEQKNKMRLVGEAWKKCSAEEKEIYKKKSDDYNALHISKTVVNKDKTKVKRGLSGYNYFIREKIKEMEGTSQKDKMLLSSKEWKSISEEDKKVWNEKAKKLNEKKN